MSDHQSIPEHIAIIMDGNGRWAESRGLPRNEGHRQGAEAVRRVLFAAQDCGVRIVTLFAFSVENWKRPQTEISALWLLLDWFVSHYIEEMIRKQIRICFIGRREELPSEVRRQIDKAESLTKAFGHYRCNIALNYGSRTEVVDAVKALVVDVVAGRSSVDTLDWDQFSQYLYTAGLPDPDLLIRTSGETRISNFLLLQCAYSELYFTPVFWPDFGKAHLEEAIESYKQRERRFGLTGKQLKDHNEPRS